MAKERANIEISTYSIYTSTDNSVFSKNSATSFWIGNVNGYENRARIDITSSIPANSSAQKLIINLKRPNTYNSGFRGSKAILSTTKINSSSKDSLSELGQNYIVSYYYQDPEGQERYVDWVTDSSTKTKLKETGAYLIFDLTQLPSFSGSGEKNLYVYLYPYDTDSSEIVNSISNGMGRINLNWSSILEFQLTIDDLCNPPIIKNGYKINSSTIYKNEQIGLTFDYEQDENNKIKGYRVYYNNSNSRNNSQYFDCQNNNPTISNSSLGNYSKGEKVNLWVQALAEKLNSEITSLGNYTIRNGKPKNLNFGLSGIVPNSKAGDVKIINLTSTDIDGDKITYTAYRAKDKDGSIIDESFRKNVVNNSTIELTSTYHYVKIEASDGESSTSKIIEAQVNLKPEISSFSFKPVQTSLAEKAGVQVARQVNGTAVVNKEGCTYNWTIGNKTISKKSSFTNLSLDDIAAGTKLSCILTVTDQYGDSATKQVDLNVYKADTFTMHSKGAEIYTNHNNYELAGYYSDTLRLRAWRPSPKDYSAKLSSYKIKINKEYRYSGSMTAYFTNNEQNKISNISTDNWQPGESFSEFQYYITDELGHTVSGTYKTKTLNNSSQVVDIDSLTKLEEARLTNFTVAPSSTWEVYSKNSSSLTIQSNYSSPKIANNNYSYILIIESEGKSEEFVPVVISQADTTINLKLDWDSVKEKFEDNSLTPVTLTMVIKNALNGYNEESSKTITNYFIDSRAIPTWTGVGKVKIGYKPSENEEIVFNDFAENDKTTSWFHTGEYLKFYFNSVPQDINLDLKKIIIEYSTDNGESYQTYYTFNNAIFEKPADSEAFFAFIGAGSLRVNTDRTGKTLTYRAFVEDSQGLRSDYIRIISDKSDNEPIRIKHCRKTPPFINISSVNLNSDQFITNIKISDWGGENKEYENFNRFNEEGATFKVFLSNDSDFANPTPVVTEIIKFSSDDYKDYTKKTAKITVNLNNINIDISKKIYFKAQILVNTTPGDYNQISNYSAIYIYYPETPTMSYRPQWVGINSTEYRDEDIFQVSKASSNRKLVRFTGDDGNKNIEIIIDLSTGEIFGATISGGTW